MDPENDLEEFGRNEVDKDRQAGEFEQAPEAPEVEGPPVDANDESAMIALAERLREQYGRYFCRRCADMGRAREAGERFSMGFYAGMYCDPCWDSDGRNHDRPFDPMDAGESMDEDY